MDTDPTSAEDTANESSDLTELDTEDEEVLEEEGATGRKRKRKRRLKVPDGAAEGPVFMHCAPPSGPWK
jgi:hypothetical protein